MAIYHFSAKMISRANGSSALAAAAYRSASRLHDQRLDRHHDFSNKAGVIHSEVMLPDGAAKHLADREELWNAVEAAEKRIDAQLAREIEFALPRELDKSEAIRLAREFVAREFVARGMVADLNVHWDIGADGEPKPHAHVMLTTRSAGEDGFGPKVRDWNRTDLLNHWRAAWSEHVNARLAELDIDARIDHRSLEAQGIDLEPQNKIGPAAACMAGQGLECERLDEHAEIARRNGDKLLASPALALDAITHQQATFTTRELARFVHRHSDGKDQFDEVMAAVRASPELVKLGKDGRGENRFTNRNMIVTELRLTQHCDQIAGRTAHSLAAASTERELAAASTAGLRLGAEQEAALRHVVQGRDMAIVVGYAGTGKSTMLGHAREAWEQACYRVHGAALSGIAAENLEAGSGIAARTLASLEHQWGQGRDLLTAHDVLVIDEAGMIGTRQMERVVAEAAKRGAKLVLVGDPEQLQAIEAGAAFRSITERYGHVEVTDVRRQRELWQRDATRHLATGRTGQAVAAYAAHGNLHVAGTRDAACDDLVGRWDRERAAEPEASCIILTHTNDEVLSLNTAARERLRIAGGLGEDVAVRTGRGERAFAGGDRVMFLRNERGLGVKNGSLGRIESVTPARMAVMLDNGSHVAFDIKDYNQIDHGYAATVHKAQGMTVDRVYVLATPGLDRHAVYVALSRHRDGVSPHYGQDDFADQGRLVHALSRERGKDMVSDYTRDFAHRREIGMSQVTIEHDRQRLDRNPIDDLRPGAAMRKDLVPPAPAVDDAPLPRPALAAAVERHARIVKAMRFAYSVGEPYTAQQRTELGASHASLNTLRPHGRENLERAFSNDLGLIDQAAKGRTASAIRMMQLESEMRQNPALRADIFVQRWQALERQRRLLLHDHESTRANLLGDRMIGMAKGLERDPQVESILRNRKAQLGLPAASTHAISQNLADLVGRGRSRGLGIEM